jgi:hypothetical protein
MTKTENVPNEANFYLSGRRKGICTFSLLLLPFDLVLPNEPNFYQSAIRRKSAILISNF